MGASAELKSVADEVVQIVSVMDGLNRYRFENDPWLAGSSVMMGSLLARQTAPAAASTRPNS